MEYTRLCGPLKGALEKLHELEREIEENERLQKESQEEVGLNLAISLVEYSIHSHQYMFWNTMFLCLCTFFLECQHYIKDWGNILGWNYLLEYYCQMKKLNSLS